MKIQQDYYEVLGVKRSATLKQIKSAFHKLARKYHPDTSSLCGAHEQFIKICNAYNILKDEEKRSEYNIELMDKMFKEHISNSRISVS